MIIRKNSLIMLALVCCIGYMTYLVFASNYVPANAPVDAQFIVIDPGHGGEDGGAEGANGTIEKDLNLAVSLELKALLDEAGIPVIMTREEDVSLGDQEKSTISARKKDDTKKRLEMVEKVGTKLYVGVHMNKFTESKYRGAQVFYSKNNPQSRSFGVVMQKSLIEGIADGNTREALVAGSGVYILNKTTVPAIIVECGMLSNPDEEKLLTTSEYQKKLARCIYVGITDYLNTMGQ